MKIFEKIVKANVDIKTAPNAVLTTPLQKSVILSEQTGANLYLKYENEQVTGSFKLRGATNNIAQLNHAQREKGIITASSGNHGLGVAMAANLQKIEATIFVPKAASLVKLDAIKMLGAKIELVEGDSYLCELKARELCEKTGKAYISPYNDIETICGQGTIGLEIMRQQPNIDAIFIATGGGGLVSGIASYVKKINPNIKIIACWPEAAKSLYENLNAGVIEEVKEFDTFSDGTAGGVEKNSITFEMCQRLVDDKILVTENEIARAMRLVGMYERKIIEGSAGVAVAAALKAIKAEPNDYKNKNVAVIICGGNIELDKYIKIVGKSDAND